MLLLLGIIAIILSLVAHNYSDISSTGHFIAGMVQMWGNYAVIEWAKAKDKESKKTHTNTSH